MPSFRGLYRRSPTGPTFPERSRSRALPKRPIRPQKCAIALPPVVARAAGFS
jgi:hypothetical protein